MANNTSQPVMAGFDGSEASRTAVRWAAQEASSRAAPLSLVHVLARPFEHSIPMRLPDQDHLLDTLRSTISRELDALEQTCREIDTDLDIDKRIPFGDAADVLSELASDAQLMVLGGPLVGSRTDQLGITAAEVIARRAKAPIAVIRGEPDAPAQAPVVVGIDGSTVSDHAIGFAFEHASRHNRPLIGVHAWSDSTFNPFHAGDDERRNRSRDHARELLTEWLTEWSQHYPDVQLQHAVGADQPAHALLEHAEGAALLVIGSHGRGPVRRTLLGSVSHAVVNQANCPVAILPAHTT
ncbi:universal stress protein [Saccharopolyspora griseoalba]|uniref:Universal stress protein n=1 Tax=Saccharopolyspora griseoalba TaxID=1431848 RepID=A0ABW2LF67_9PSEU